MADFHKTNNKGKHIPSIFGHEDTPEEEYAKQLIEEGGIDSVLDAFDRMSATTTASFESESKLPEFHGSKKETPIMLPGMYGSAFFNAKPSAELLEKEQERQQREQGKDDYNEKIAVLEKGLCEKFNITPPHKWPNRRQDRGESGEQILVLGQTVNDRKHPKLWGIRQEDRTRHQLCLGASGSGKQVSDYTPVLTDKGWELIGNIKIGDKVYNRYGKLTTVIALHKEKQKQVWEIEFADGQVIDTYSTHPWIIERSTHGGIKEFVKTTEEMYDEGIYRKRNKKGYKNRVILCEPIDFPEAKLSIHPYVLGAIIGDGCLRSKNQVQFSTADQDNLDRLMSCLPSNYTYRKKNPSDPKDVGYVLQTQDENGNKHNAKELYEKFDELGLCQRSEHKFIPEKYLFASIEQRRELLKGLMDTDGTAHGGRLSFCTISERLRDNFLHLVRSLGYEAHVQDDYRPEKYKRSNGHAWNVSFFANDVENIFALKRKQKTLTSYRKNRNDIINRIARKDPILYDTGYNQPSALPAPPYTYGTFLGRAFIDGSTFLSNLPDISRKEIKKEYNNVVFKDGYNSQGAHISLFAAGEKGRNNRPKNRIYHDLLNTSWHTNIKKRRIDECYMKASLEDRMKLLQAFIIQKGKMQGKRIEFHNSNVDFLKDLSVLLESCGYTVQLSKINEMTWQLKLMNPDKHLIIDEKQYSVLERNGAFSNSKKRENSNKSMAIVDIRKTNRYADMTCLTVEEGESYILNGFIVTHNSTLLHAIGVEDMWYWRGGLLMEPHGDLALSLLKTAPPYRLHDIIYLNVLDPIASPGFNPLELPPNPTDEDRQEAVGAVTSLIAKHFNMDTGYVKLLKMLTNALNALSYVPGATLLEVMQFYNNENIRETILSFVPSGPQKDAMRDVAENAKADDLGSLDNRISRFTTNRYMRHLFGQSHTTVNFYDLMNQGYFIICPVAKGATKDDVFLKFYGSYIVSEIYKAAVMREAILEGERVNFALTLDEFQNFISEDIETILAEARKYGLMMLLANQMLDQLQPKTMKSAVLQNCATKLCYSLGPTDAPEMAKAFGHGVTAEDMMNIPKYHIMAAPLIRGGYGQPFISSVFPPISLKSDVSNITAELIAEISRNRYMKKRDDIEKEIADRTERYASGNKDAIIELVTKKNS